MSNRKIKVYISINGKYSTIVIPEYRSFIEVDICNTHLSPLSVTDPKGDIRRETKYIKVKKWVAPLKFSKRLGMRLFRHYVYIATHGKVNSFGLIRYILKNQQGVHNE